MAENSTIEWTDATWNPITGCSVISPGCTNCYAMKLAGTRLRNHPSRTGLTIDTKAGPVWTGDVRLNTAWLGRPASWARPRRIFVCAHGDLFHERVPDEWIDRVMRQMGAAGHHTFQVLTKRSARMAAYMADRRAYVAYNSARLEPNVWPPRNVWLGVSVEDQARADERIPSLLSTPARTRFVSFEPMLGPASLRNWLNDTRIICDSGDHDCRNMAIESIRYLQPPDTNFVVPLCPVCGGTAAAGINARIDWVICGGESGPGARPMHPDWARSLRDQCQGAGVPFFFKQWGGWAPAADHMHRRPFPFVTHIGAQGEPLPGDLYRYPIGSAQMAYVGKKVAGAMLDGREWREMPGAEAPIRATSDR